ncbi:MAG: hypothetical protein M3492_03780 [Actinomycetota bacterium]|nr:hypothetical protein [Actinomycetota bacterium]
MERAVAQDDEVEKAEMAGGGEQDLGGFADRQAVDPPVRDVARVSGHVQSGPPRPPSGIGYGKEHRKVAG